MQQETIPGTEITEATVPSEFWHDVASLSAGIRAHRAAFNEIASDTKDLPPLPGVKLAQSILLRLIAETETRLQKIIYLIAQDAGMRIANQSVTLSPQEDGSLKLVMDK